MPVDHFACLPCALLTNNWCDAFVEHLHQFQGDLRPTARIAVGVDVDPRGQRAADLLEGASGGLYLCNPEQQQARCVVSYNTPDDYTGTVLAYGEGAAGTVAATGEALIIDDYQTWQGRARTFESAHPFSAVISAPMLWHGQVTGVIHVLQDTQKYKFTEEDLKLLTAFANQAAVVVENARLFEETQRRLERLSVLRRIDQVIASSLDLHVTLNIMVGQILQNLEVDAAAVLLYKPELQSLEFVA